MICETCEQELGGHSIYCPENTDIAFAKWRECVCFVHTCWDEKARKASEAR